MNYYIRRVAQAVVTMFAGMFFAFALFRLMPGGPLEAIMADIIQEQVRQTGRVNVQEVQRRAEALTGINPDTGVIEAYVNYMSDIILNQDFGRSIAYSDPVFDILFMAMPWSVFVSVYGLLLGFTANIMIGATMAWFHGTKIDSGLTGGVLLLSSIPYYVVAIVLLVVVGFQWGLLPTGGRYPGDITAGFNLDFMIGITRHAILPIGTGFIVGLSGGSLTLRGNTVRILGADYLRSARLRGLSTNRILTRYLTRNSILPLYTGLVMGIAAIFSSSVIMERIFQYPGVGWYTFEAFQTQDYPLLMGSFIFFTGLTIIGIFVADMTYPLIDPRAKSGADRESY